MKAFLKAEALAGRRYDRDKLLAMVDEVTTHFRMPNSFERSKMRAVCRYLADALDRCSGSTLQQRWNEFEKRFWPKWKAGVDRRGREYWTWGARVLISARMIAPSQSHTNNPTGTKIGHTRNLSSRIRFCIAVLMRAFWRFHGATRLIRHTPDSPHVQYQRQTFLALA